MENKQIELRWGYELQSSKLFSNLFTVDEVRSDKFQN